MGTGKFVIANKIFDNIKIESAILIYEASEKRLNDTLAIDESLTNRCYTLLGLMIPSIVGLISYLLSLVSVEKPIVDLFIPMIVLLFICVLGCASFILVSCIFPKELSMNGIDPNEILTLEMYEMMIRDEKVNETIAFYLTLINYLQTRIDINRRANLKRFAYFKLALKTVLLGVTLLFCLVCVFLFYR
jgi:hypothetical protein